MALHSSPETIKNKILCYRKRNFLTFHKGFGHQVFNICCKYNAINIWHGIVPEKLNPLHSIKKIIIAANLGNDLQIGRVHTCSFSTIFLSNPFIYQKNYHIPEPFDRTHYSSVPNDSPVLIKALSPKGSCDSRARMGSNWFYLYFNCCLRTYFDVSKCALLSAFLKSWKCFILMGGWMDGWMGGWVVIFYPLRFPFFQVC